jgi:hypothetical protein
MVKELTQQQKKVLAEIDFWMGDTSIYTIAYWTEYPVASVRRTLQELRRRGHKITLKSGRVRLVRR